MRVTLSLRQYASYAAVAVAAFLVTVSSREAFAWMLPADTAWFYTVSMAMAYALGIVVNFTLQHALTFRSGRSDKSWGMFLGFVAVAALGGAVTVAAALAFRYVLGFPLLFGELAGTAAFVAGTVIASVVTYWMNARFVFAGPKNSATSRS